MLQFVGNNAFVATVLEGGFQALSTAAADDRINGLNLLALEPMRSEYKLETTVAEGEIGEWAVNEDNVASVRVEYWSDAEADALIAAIENVGGQVVERSDAFETLTVEVPESAIGAIGNLNGVSWIEPISPPFQEFNDSLRMRVGGDALAAAPFNLSGQGVRVGVWDGGRVDGHDDFGTRIHPTIGDIGSNVSNHATHVAGTIGGDGGRSQTEGGAPREWQGVAPDVDFYSWDFFGNTPNEVIDAINSATDGIDLSTNSWGFRIEGQLNNCNLYGDYPGIARDYDRIVRGDAATRPLPVLFAAGNERNDGDCGMSSQPPFENYAVVSPPGTAKNIITVGASNSNDDTMTTFSSWGPVDDGRIKPDVTAPGCQSNDDGVVTSTVIGNGYGSMCGTSMATPATAGIVAMLLEHFDNEGLAVPLPSTLKALLIHTAVDVGRPGPDYAFGYGRIDGVAAAEAITNRLTTEGVLTASGQVQTQQVQVIAGTPEFRATLVWDDAAAFAGAALTLVNDLDLRVIDPSGSEHRPFVLNPAAPANNAGQGVDAVNVVEQVVVTNPAAGTWEVEVASTRIAQGPQRYSLVTLSSAATPPPPPPPPQLRYFYTTLRVITKAAPR
ncbi:MAG: S8 family serine peptidase, partial [Boseongicola sp.]|nr:S8 family serine peptidase [Boseongicola sp.]